MIFDLADNPIAAIPILLGLLLGITVHEFSHAFLADRLGDPTPRLLGRVTLNPLAHLDPIGTLALLLFRFGWGKPVLVESRNFRHPLTDEIQVSLAGPFANLVLAVGIGLVLRLIPVSDVVAASAAIVIQINLVLMIFNLLPIPPLDGSRLLALFLPPAVYRVYETYGLIILLALFFLGGPILSQIFFATVIPLTQIITGQ